MRIRWWPHTADPDTASTRLRCLRIIEALRAQSHDVALYSTREAPPDVLVLAKRYDAASIEHATRLRTAAGTRIALDLCDNHFYSERPSLAWTKRANALRDAVGRVDLVVVSTSALEEVVVTQCPARPPLTVIGDAAEPPSGRGASLAHPWAELQLASLKRRMRRDGIAAGRRLVWFGNHGSPNADSGMGGILAIRDDLDREAQRAPLSLTIISNSRSKFRQLMDQWRLPLYYLPWHAATFSRALRLHDVAVLPIRVNPFSRCKSNNRVVTALLHDLSVITDPIPSYLELQPFVYLDDWRESLGRALQCGPENEQRRSAGARYIATNLGITAIAERWLHTLTQLGERGAGAGPG
jgi:hypothetical protein